MAQAHDTYCWPKQKGSVRSAVYGIKKVEERFEQYIQQKPTERWILLMIQTTKEKFTTFKVKITFISFLYLLQLRPASISES